MTSSEKPTFTSLFTQFILLNNISIPIQDSTDEWKCPPHQCQYIGLREYLARLLSYPMNSHTDGYVDPTDKDITLAIKILTAHEVLGHKAPSISTTGEGGFVFSWKAPNKQKAWTITLKLETSPDGKLEFMIMENHTIIDRKTNLTIKGYQH